MVFRKIFFILFFIFIERAILYSGEILFVNKNPLGGGAWRADTVFICSELAVADSTVPVTVKLKGSWYTGNLGEMYFMYPSNKDSAIFLFHNIQDNFPDEADSVNLGTFPLGTSIVFMYVVVGMPIIDSNYINKKMYTGQNREGIDIYVSEKSPSTYGKCFSALGRIDESTVEVGFDEGALAGCANVIIRVRGVNIIN